MNEEIRIERLVIVSLNDLEIELLKTMLSKMFEIFSLEDEDSNTVELLRKTRDGLLRKLGDEE